MPKDRSWFTIRAAARAEGEPTPPAPDGETPEPEIESTSSAEISIRGFIGDWGINDRALIEAVEELGPVQKITVLINSRGGEVDHALAIFNYLRNHPAQIVTRVTGVAMSSASVILMAGDRIEMPANTLLMIHNPEIWGGGDEEALRDAAAQAAAWKQSLLETYMARTGKPEQELRDMMAAETFMTAQEAVDNGFADVVLPIDSNLEAAPDSSTATARGTAVAIALASALGIPADVAARLAAQADAAPAAATESQPTPAGNPGGSEGGDPASDAPAVPAGTEQPAAAAGTTFVEQFAALASADGMSDYVSAFLLDGSLDTLEKARAALAEAREIRDLCAYADAADRAPGFIRSRRALAEVRAELLTARAADADRHHANGTPPTQGAAPAQASQPTTINTGDIYAQRRAAAQAAAPNLFRT